MTLPKKWVRPRHGIILAGIPSAGAEVEGRLAKEWIDNGLVEEIPDPTEEPKFPERSGAVNNAARRLLNEKEA